jgi:hypothetical protein
MRERPLPPDTLVVIKIAGGCTETIHEAKDLTGRSSKALKEAAVLYLAQILFAPSSDCYRVLGVVAETPRSKMREHMRWLMLWLHPDHNANEWESVFADRVLHAWSEASASSREPNLPLVQPLPSRRRRRLKQRWVAMPLRSPRLRERRRRIAAAVLVGVLGLALSSFAAIGPLPRLLALATAQANVEDDAR